MNERAIEELRQSEADLLAQLGRVRAALTALTGEQPLVSGSLNGHAHSPSQPTKNRLRAPKGLMAERILATIKATPKLTAGEIEAALRRNGYEWPVSAEYVSKALMKLKAGKQVAMSVNAGRFEYSAK